MPVVEPTQKMRPIDGIVRQTKKRHTQCCNHPPHVLLPTGSTSDFASATTIPVLLPFSLAVLLPPRLRSHTPFERSRTVVEQRTAS